MNFEVTTGKLVAICSILAFVGGLYIGWSAAHFDHEERILKLEVWIGNVPYYVRTPGPDPATPHPQ